MPILTIGGNSYNYPSPGTDPGWGGEASDWAVAVTEVLNSFLGPGDILPTDFLIIDDISAPSDIEALIFDGALVRAANVTYAIERDIVTEQGTLFLTFNGGAAPGEQWTLTQQSSNPVGVAFSITDAGQVQYISTATGENGNMKFSAKTLGT